MSKKTTRIATIAEALEVIKDSRKVVNVVVLPPNAGDSGNQDSDTEEFSAESIEEIYKSARELEIEEDLESDNEAKLLLSTPNKRRRQELPRWKIVSGFERAFQGVELISQEICKIWRKIYLTNCGKICFPTTYWSTFSLNHLYNNEDQNSPHLMVSNKKMPFLVVILLTSNQSLPE